MMMEAVGSRFKGVKYLFACLHPVHTCIFYNGTLICVHPSVLGLLATGLFLHRYTVTADAPKDLCLIGEDLFDT